MNSGDEITHQEKLHTPILSVVIPVYNVEDYLTEALDSVRNQSFRDVEFIVINDGSEDGSAKILDVISKTDNRFRTFYQENAGLSAARNAGLDKAKGKYVYFFDSDDVLVEDTFRKVINRIENTASDLGFFPLLFIDEHGNNLPKKIPKKELEQEFPIHGEQFLQKLNTIKEYGINVQRYTFKRSFLLDNNLRFDEGYIHEDEAFSLEAICLAKRVISFNEPMLKKRFRRNSIMSEKIGIKNVEGWTKAISRMLTFMNQNKLSGSTQSIILKRSRQLAHNCLNILYKLNGTGENTSSLGDYLKKDELDRLGFFVRLHTKTHIGYRLLKKIMRLLGF